MTKKIHKTLIIDNPKKVPYFLILCFMFLNVYKKAHCPSFFIKNKKSNK